MRNEESLPCRNFPALGTLGVVGLSPGMIPVGGCPWMKLDIRTLLDEGGCGTTFTIIMNLSVDSRLLGCQERYGLVHSDDDTVMYLQYLPHQAAPVLGQ